MIMIIIFPCSCKCEIKFNMNQVYLLVSFFWKKKQPNFSWNNFSSAAKPNIDIKAKIKNE